MPPTKLPQREMLRRMLDSGTLTPTEMKVVRKLHDEIANGQIGGLNGQQAAWAEEICRRCGIVVERPRTDTRKKGKEAARQQVAAFDAMPRPKKPPGRA